MTRIPVLRVLMMLLTFCMLLATLAGCTLTFGDAHIRGTIYGDPLLDKISTPTTPVPLAATVRCNGVSVTASATGKYELKLPVSEQYHCTASAPPNYVPQSITLHGNAGANLMLDFGPTNLPFSCVETRAHMQCAIIHLKTGNITGKVTYHGGSIPASGAMVRCITASKLATADPLTLAPTLWPQAEVTTQGTFAIEATAPGLYDCFASAPGGDLQHTRTLLAPGGTVSLSFSVCGSKCNPVHYHGGPVMHTYTAYLIFWLPKSYTFEPSGDDTRFESSIAQYFKDIGGTPFYGLLTQYWDYHGAVENSAQLGDVYVDTTPYERCDFAETQCSRIAASQRQPLFDEDIRREIERAVHAHPSWHTDLNSEFFVFTGYNVEECQSSATNDGCTFTTDPKRGYCGYHDAFSNSSPDSTSTTPLIYSYISDAANHCLWNNGYSGPHSDNLIDSEISIVSHEQFESVTDPLPLRKSTIGWNDDAQDLWGEIGDKCVGDFGTIQPDGSNITLAHGHTYILQAEWSNRANRCSFS
ncbi:MAG TPA: carboxypeptidase-like regulatory domain-containing protein [Ktedonobacterales bacterium]